MTRVRFNADVEARRARRARFWAVVAALISALTSAWLGGWLRA